KKKQNQNTQHQKNKEAEQKNMLSENATRKRFVTQQTIENTTNQIDLAKTVYDEMVLQQKQGTSSLTEILLADNALREAQQNQLTAIIDYLKAD
ncbi:MAG: TolC family protein, partial [Flavobacterium sp.]|nr:TolC family protein [Flavobacterium sp.]